MTVVGDEIAQHERMDNAGDRGDDRRRAIEVSAVDDSILGGDHVVDRRGSLIAVAILN